MRKIALFAIALAAITFGAGTQTVNAETVTETKTPEPIQVTVAEGDTLSAIAERNNTTYLRIYYANEKIINPDVINPGDVYRIPAADEQLAERQLPQPVAAVSAPAAQYQAYAPTSSAYRAQSFAAPAAPQPTYSAPAVSGNDAKAFIYARESGNNPNATNPNGCYGLGQDCNGVLRSQCGADYACQDAYFDRYAANRYGGWDGAKAFWDANGWW